MPSARAPRHVWAAAHGAGRARGAGRPAPRFRGVQPGPAPDDLRRVLSRLADSLLAPRATADELDEARELLTYWESRARRLPRWALGRRREARETAARWRDRVRAAEQARYGAGLLGVASQLAAERRMPTTLAHRGRRAVRLVAYTAATAAVTLLVVAAVAMVAVANAVLGAL